MSFNREFRRKKLKGVKSEEINSVTDKVAEQMVGDALLVIMDILSNHWKDINPRATRLEVFGRLFKEKYYKQSITHDLTYLPLLNEADLRRIKYGENEC